MYQFPNKRNIARRKKIVRYIIILAVLFLFVIFSGFKYLSHLVNYFGQTIWRAENIASKNINDSSYILNSRKNLFLDNERLRQENENLKLSMIDYQVLKKENEELKKILGRLPSENNFVLGNILVKPGRSPYDTLVIDVGKDNEIEKGNRVYGNGYIPIGEVSEVYEKTSLVTMYSSQGVKTEGLLDDTNSSIELVGRGGGNFEMIVSSDLPSEVGTLVYIPGSSSQILAYISGVISTPTDPIKKVLLASPINSQNLKWVEVKIN